MQPDTRGWQRQFLLREEVADSHRVATRSTKLRFPRKTRNDVEPDTFLQPSQAAAHETDHFRPMVAMSHPPTERIPLMKDDPPGVEEREENIDQKQLLALHYKPQIILA